MAETKVASTELDIVPAWSTPTYQNSWVAFDAGGTGNYGGLQYSKDPAGVVHLKGLMKSGTATAGTVIANLPAGFRPNNLLYFSTVANDLMAAVRITNAGDVVCSPGVSAVWTSFANISFRAEA